MPEIAPRYLRCHAIVSPGQIFLNWFIDILRQIGFAEASSKIRPFSLLPSLAENLGHERTRLPRNDEDSSTSFPFLWLSTMHADVVVTAFQKRINVEMTWRRYFLRIDVCTFCHSAHRSFVPQSAATLTRAGGMGTIQLAILSRMTIAIFTI